MKERNSQIGDEIIGRDSHLIMGAFIAHKRVGNTPLLVFSTCRSYCPHGEIIASLCLDRGLKFVDWSVCLLLIYSHDFIEGFAIPFYGLCFYWNGA